MASTEDYMRRLLESEPLRVGVLRSAIAALRLPRGSIGLDAGCGIGLQVLLLAEEVGPEGHVTGLDIRWEFLAEAIRIAQGSEVYGRISFEVGDVNRLPFGENAFDWVWSASCVGYPARDPVPLIRELARVVRRGGRLAILVWSSQMLLPGYPLLEARLNATSAGVAPFTRGMCPRSHWLRAMGWFREAGLREVTARTLVGEVRAPLEDGIRRAMVSLFEMRWGGARSEVAAEHWREYERLCRPDSPDFILDCDDYYAFFTETLFHGGVAECP